MSSFTPSPLHGLILAGGASRRMQQDKAYLACCGEPQLLRTFHLVASHVDRCFVSVRHDQRDDPLRATFPQIVDQHDACGPAAGILAAQEQAPEAAWLVVACDMPLLDDNTLRTLSAARDPDADVTAFTSPVDGLPEPLCAIWEPSSRVPLRHAIERGEKSLRRVLDGLRIHRLIASDSEALFNANTPEDLSRILDSDRNA
ncbi:NTP transferase domain-containing protein [Xanthomonadaceae bacterium JHOS43]|nr:NTP transferase domain-containing protein [Xanthomonadaceae bacterium JHOS43]